MSRSTRAKRLMQTGMVLVVVYCVSQSFWLWNQSGAFSQLVNSAGMVDPEALRVNMRNVMWATYVSNMSLGMGLLAIAWGLFLIHDSPHETSSS